MMKILKKKDGFTLIEMLIVLFIIAVLSTLAINGYTQYRRTALLDFSVDSFIAQFYGLRDNTVHGDYGGDDFERISEAINDPEVEYDPGADGDGEAKCYGFYFLNEGEGYFVKKVEVPYSNKKRFDSDTDSWVSVGCGEDILGGLSDVNLDDQVSVLGVYIDGIESDNFSVLFVPPNGDIQGPFGAEEVMIEIKYGESDEEKYKRNIFIDLQSGQAYVTKNENVEEI